MEENKKIMYPNCVIKVEYDKTKPEEYAKEFTYSDFVKTVINNKYDFASKINRMHIYPNGDNIMNVLCGVAPIWKKHDSKEMFEKYYTMSETMRILYANEVENEELVPIYIEINGNKFIVTWEEIEGEDIFNYKRAVIDDLGILDIIGSVIPAKDNNDLDIDTMRLIHIPNLIVVHDDNITLKQYKEVYERMSYHGYSRHNVIFEA